MKDVLIKVDMKYRSSGPEMRCKVNEVINNHREVRQSLDLM